MWSPVWVVVDGSTDNTTPELHRMAASDPCLRVLVLPRNRGKGAAVLHGLRAAMAQSFTHALTLDADGQHNAADIPDMMEVSTLQPEVMVLGRPIFDASAPRARVLGRQIANLLADLQTRRAGIGDSLFGMRVYPIAPLIEVFSATRWMRRFDFDPEAAIRLCWRGVRPVAFPTEVHYFRSSEGGVSHFCYVRSNLLLAFMYVRLQTALLGRLLRVEPQ